MSPKKNSGVTLRLLFADRGNFHEQTVKLPAEALDGHERLIDALRESHEVNRRLAVSLKRLVSAEIVEE